MAELDTIIKSISAMNLVPAGKYVPKLDFDQRCEILALYRTGLGRTILSAAYGIDRRTITHIYNPKSKHYKSVRAEEKRLGKDAFQKKYLTENVLIKLRNFAEVNKANPPKVGRPKKSRANRSASRFAGVHTIMNDNLERPHTVQIGWEENPIDGVGAGWYYRDMDGDPSKWLHNGEESTLTSKDCLEAVQENLFEL